MRRKSWEHTTRDELNYLKQIGSFRVSRNEGTLKLLNRYRSSAMDRTEWGDIKKEIVLDFVNKRIEELRRLK
jgi:hypothetical protein